MRFSRSLLLGLLLLFVLGSVADAAVFGRRRVRTRGGITVRAPGGGTYTWYGPGGVVAARRAAARYNYNYTPAANTLPVQRDVTQSQRLRYATFPTVPRRE